MSASKGRESARRRHLIGKTLLIVGLIAGLGLLALEGLISWQASSVADTAAQRMGRDRVQALIATIGCKGCPLEERKMAVWAAGQLSWRDRAAMTPLLPALYAEYDGKKCDHERRLCQYELWKAIKKVEGSWDLRASLLKKGEVRGLGH
jgi:hypothetical protein